MAYAPEEWNLIIGKLYIYLEDNGVAIWAPQYLQPDTENWNGAIEQAQLESPCLLAIVSEKSLELSHVQRAIRHFVTRDKPIILVQLGKIKRMPMMIENLPMLRFDTGDPIRSFSKILEEIRKLNLNDYE
jgi:hypothetical protein